MDEVAKTSHVLRRLGLGAGRQELAKYPKGSKATIDALLNDDQVDDAFDLDPWRFMRQDDGKLETGSYIVGPWWALRMVLTKAPAKEKLTLFWHDHFALDGDKVGEGPTMLAYLDVLRSKGRGKFKDLLKAVMTQGAMLLYLDGQTSHRIRPNENLARETFELFTMGEGSGYTEKDIKELARALTGWSMHYMGNFLEEKYEQTKKRADENRMALQNFCYVPALHDEGVKVILGKSANFSGEEALDWIASRPQTAKYICTKLWAYYAYPDPEPKVVEKLMAAWKASDGEIRAVLRAIVNQPEFWSERCVESMPKSPADWIVANFRAMDLREDVLKGHVAGASEKAIEKNLRELAGTIYYLMAQQGMQLLYPPNVAGWNWGAGWLGADTSVKRIKSSDGLFWTGGETRPYAIRTVALLKGKGVTDPASIVDGFLELFDARISPEQKATLVGVCEKRGGMKALENKDQSANLFAGISRALFACPEYQLC